MFCALIRGSWQRQHRILRRAPSSNSSKIIPEVKAVVFHALLLLGRCYCAVAWPLAAGLPYSSVSQGRVPGWVAVCQRGFLPFMFSLIFAGFCVLIFVECSSYHCLEEFITLSPPLVPWPMMLRIKRAIVWRA